MFHAQSALQVQAQNDIPAGPELPGYEIPGCGVIIAQIARPFKDFLRFQIALEERGRDKKIILPASLPRSLPAGGKRDGFDESLL